MIERKINPNFLEQNLLRNYFKKYEIQLPIICKIEKQEKNNFIREIFFCKDANGKIVNLEDLEKTFIIKKMFFYTADEIIFNSEKEIIVKIKL